MPKIINAYAGNSPLSEALAGFANSFGQNTPAMEVARQKAYGLSRENTNIPLLADAVTGDDPALTARLGILSGVDPKVTGGYRQYHGVQKYGPGSAEATRDTMSVPGANFGNTVQGTNQAEANRRAIEDKRTQRMFDIERYKFDNTYEQTVGPDGRVILTPRTQAAGLVSGEQARLDNQRAIEDKRTQRVFDSERYKTDNTPETVMTDAGPQIVRRSEAFGQRPVLSQTQAQGAILQTDTPNMTPEQRARAGGYEPRNPANAWTYQTPDGRQGTTVDAKTDAQTGAPLPGGTKVMKLEGANTEGLTGNNTVDRMRFESANNRDRAVQMIDNLTATLSQPNADQAVGYLGTLARGFNDLRAQSEATVRLFGGELKDQAFTSPENRAAVDGVMTTVFGNPQVAAKAQQLGINSAIIRSQVQDLAYMIAKSQDPSGRVSNDDIRRASETVAATIMDPKSSVAVLQDLKSRVIQGHDIFEKNLRIMYPGATRMPGGSNAPAAAPAQPAQADPLGIR